MLHDEAAHEVDLIEDSVLPVLRFGRPPVPFEIQQDHAVRRTQLGLDVAPGVETGPEAVEEKDRLAFSESYVMELNRLWWLSELRPPRRAGSEKPEEARRQRPDPRSSRVPRRNRGQEKPYSLSFR